ncbi:hypothetical protein M422DRAFT_189388 [Sphaerobolus stellatus SS14]|uniref:Uncharacterized protein n=1 Tax=Sphaerobolus stellatus (strain SS14) TaxID=990650 RepID=A0A0C9UIH8_SPHS4|nr:hypothetical protein M422DRAFT_189388 [Sphaerobolus stellatus SS14]
MVATLNFYLAESLSFTWRESSLLAAKAAGRGERFARNIRMWVYAFLHAGKLPMHRYGHFRSSILEDEDIEEAIQLQLLERSKNSYIRAEDILEIINTPELQEMLSTKTSKTSFSVRTARRWLKRLNWRYGCRKNGMYIDGHERQDVVEYRNGFLKRWKEYEKRMVIYDNDGNVLSKPQGFPVPGHRFQLILVTHDESTFYANDRHKTKWTHSSEKANPERKGEGASIMISDFLTPEWGRLKDEDECARLVFKAGKNRDGYFSHEDFMKQVEKAVDIFEVKTKARAMGLFMFDNAPSHQKRAPDALSARRMPKGPSDGWSHHKDGPKMRPGRLPNGEIQSFYFSEDHPTMPGWFKGMEQIIRERGLWPAQGLLAQCPGFKCEPGCTDCCCRRILFSQPDFCQQKSHLEEYITARGHICDFYPKFHCELNFIEQYWGASKWLYRSTPKTNDIQAMENNVLACLDQVPQIQILRYANRSARFISAYSQGLTGAQAVWANKKYHGHRTLPPEMVKQAIIALPDV